MNLTEVPPTVKVYPYPTPKMYTRHKDKVQKQWNLRNFSAKIKWKKGSRKSQLCREILLQATWRGLYYDTVGSVYYYIFSGKKTASWIRHLIIKHGFFLFFFLLNYNVSTTTKHSTEIHKKPKSLRNYLHIFLLILAVLSSTLLVSVNERLTWLGPTILYIPIHRDLSAKRPLNVQIISTSYQA